MMGSISECQPFDIIVVGAGIAGLAAAAALIQQGHHVKIIEAAPELQEIGAGIQVPPNSVRVLHHLGVFEELSSRATHPQRLSMRKWNDGSEIGTTPMRPAMQETYGFPYLLIHRGDLHNILLKRCIQLKAEIILNASVTAVDQAQGIIFLADGTTYSADLIIGADGIKSKVRNAVIPSHEVSTQPDTNCAFRALIPGPRLLEDPVLKPLIESPTANCWIGDGGHIMAYPIRNGELYNFVMNHPGTVSPGKTFEPVPIDEIRWRFKSWDPIVLRLINLVPECSKWLIAELGERLNTWVSQSGKVVLIGDASHAMLPYMSQGAAMAVEDAAVLAECISRAQNVDALSRLLKEYEKIRSERCYTIREGAREHGEIWKLPDGPEQEKRDRLMGAQASNGDADRDELENPNKWSDKKFSHWLFGYDAYEVTRQHFDAIGEDRQQRAV